MWNFFEQPWTLLITAAVLLLVVAVIYPFVHAKSKRRLWLIPLLVATMGPVLDFAVSTDRERIEKVIDTGVTAFENENCNAIAAIISENYRDSAHSDKTALLKRCRAVLRPPAVSKVYDSILDMQASGNTASLTTLNRIFFDEQSYYAELARVVVVKVQIDLEKGSDGNWLVTRTEVLAINNQPTKWSNINYPNW
jgi:hypothetical protein